MVEYDASVITQYVTRLKFKANWAILSHSIVGFIIGLLVGVLFARNLSVALSDLTLIVIFMTIGILIGYLRGREAAFKIQIQAQQILCQVAIEQNTRDRSNSKITAA